MTLRAWIRCWWTDDPNVTPCPRCGCPLQAPPRRSMQAVLADHFAVVHPGELVPALAASGGAP